MQKVDEEGRPISASLRATCNHFSLPLEEAHRVDAAVCDALTTSLSDGIEAELGQIARAEVLTRLTHESTRAFAAQRELLREFKTNPQWMRDVCDAINQSSGFGLNASDCGNSDPPAKKALPRSETSAQLLERASKSFEDSGRFCMFVQTAKSAIFTGHSKEKQGSVVIAANRSLWLISGEKEMLFDVSPAGTWAVIPSTKLASYRKKDTNSHRRVVAFGSEPALISSLYQEPPELQTADEGVRLSFRGSRGESLVLHIDATSAEVYRVEQVDERGSLEVELVCDDRPFEQLALPTTKEELRAQGYQIIR
jgi:hypothetical protein